MNENIEVFQGCLLFKLIKNCSITKLVTRLRTEAGVDIEAGPIYGKPRLSTPDMGDPH